MTNVKDLIVAKIDAIEMRASTYRVARRLLDRAHEANGLVILTYDETLKLCDTDSHETVRGQLARLAALGLITYRRNSQVNVFWHGWPEALAMCYSGANCSYPDTNRARVEQAAARAAPPPSADVFHRSANCVYPATNRAMAEQDDYYESLTGAEVLPHDTNCIYPDTNRATGEQANTPPGHELTKSRHGDANCSYSDTNRAGGEHLYSKPLSKQASISLHDQPACLLEEGGAGGGPDGDGCAAPGNGDPGNGDPGTTT